MRLYSGSSKQFIQDSIQNQIAGKLKRGFCDYFGYDPPEGEVRSWQNSLRALSQTVQYAELMDNGILLEYQLPLTSRRLDCLISGRDANGFDNAVIIELKQWDKCEESIADNEVVTWLNGAKRDIMHPSVQVGRYRMYLEDMSTVFYEGPVPIKLNACAYLHNYHPYPDDVIFAEKFSTALKLDPVFTADDVEILKKYLSCKLVKGNGLDILAKIENSRYRPSKKLMEHVGTVIKGKPQYILLDGQGVVYDMVFAEARKGFSSRLKTVMSIKGGPGTGKSVIAINLMADLLLSGYNAQYATGSRAFTQTLREVIGSRGAVQFKYFNSYMRAEPDEIDVLICDESHRIRKTSNNRFTKAGERSGLAQIDELIKVAKVCVFLLDDKQVVRPDEIGSVELIAESAYRNKCKYIEFDDLDIQFRCGGSDAFINWINNTLSIKRTTNVLWEQKNENFDFQIYNSPNELEKAIRLKAETGDSARMTAGFCWEWSNADNNGMLADDVVIGDFKRPWNAKPEAGKLAPGVPKATLWANDPNGINQVGCIYTAQGFEFDYVGVIFGEDLTYDLDKQSWVGDRTKSADSVVRRSGDKFIDLIKNTYRVLLTRGMKGCYVYFMNKDTERFFKSRIANQLN